MKKALKILAVVLALVLVGTVFAACGKKTTNESESNNQGTETKLKTVTDGKLTMATNASFPPYEYYDGKTIVGIDAEIAALIAEKLGLELVIEDTEFNSIIPGVQSGKYDIGMAGMTADEDRLKDVDFSTSYAKGVQVVIVKDGGSINSLDDLEGKKIGVQEATTGDIYASDDFGDDAVVRYANGGVAVEALKSGKVDCVIIDNEPAKAYVAANEGLKILETSYADEDYAICFKKGNTEIKDAVDKALVELINEGKVKEIVEKYIPAE